MANEIPRWKVQAALRLLGLDPAKMEQFSEVSITIDSINSDFGFASIVDTVEDTRLHVLSIDPENGNAELNPVEDTGVAYFTGAKMYLDGGSRHANGTLMPIFKRRS